MGPDKPVPIGGTPFSIQAVAPTSFVLDSVTSVLPYSH